MSLLNSCRFLEWDPAPIRPTDETKVAVSSRYGLRLMVWKLMVPVVINIRSLVTDFTHLVSSLAPIWHGVKPGRKLAQLDQFC